MARARLRMSGVGRDASSPQAGVFPLEISSDDRYLQQADGTPFLPIGDALWTAEVQLTRAQMETVAANRAAAGYTCVITEAFERTYSDNSPAWETRDGVIPFTTTANSGSMTWTSRNEAYWADLDYWVDANQSRDMVVILNFAYMGFGGSGTSDGWYEAIAAGSDADLFAYGQFMGARYPWVIWCFLGDDAGDGNTITPGAVRNKQRQIALGIKDVNPDAIFTAHPARNGGGGATDGEGYLACSTYAEFNLNSIYGTESDLYVLAATAETRGMPYFMIESAYEQGGSSESLRKAVWQSLCSGACGAIGGQFPRWGLGASGAGGTGVTDCLNDDFATSGDTEINLAGTLLNQYDWWTRVPYADLVDSSLGSGTSRICPVRGTYTSGTKHFAHIYVPSATTVTLDMTAYTQASVRVRTFSVGTGAFTDKGTFANTGTQDIVCGGECVIVAD